MTKFPDISLTLVKWPKFPDIFSKFPDNSLTWRKFCFSLTFPWHVATLYLLTAYVVRWEGNVFTCVCPSICLSTPGGVPWPGPGGGGGGILAKSRWERCPTSGTPPVGPGQGVPNRGYPTMATPIRPGRGGTLTGVPHLGYPHQNWPGDTPPQVHPLLDLAGGYPLSDLAGGTLTGYPISYRITDGVLDTPRSVCLLRSRRRTFLLKKRLKSTSNNNDL